MKAEEYTLGEMFQDAGYTTGCFGKWGMGGPESITGQPEPEGHPNNQGFDEFYGYLSQGKAHWYYPEFLWHNQQKITLNKKSYSHDLIMSEAIKFIENNTDKPFFYIFAGYPPTTPNCKCQTMKYWTTIELRTGLDQPYVAGGYSSQKEPHAVFAAMVARLDRDMNTINKLLIEKGLDKNTLIVFTSDNGPHQEGGADPDFFDSNGIYRGYKRDLYEGGIHMPTFAYWPETIKAGSENDTPSAFWDILPTFADIAGFTLPDNVASKIDGQSFAGELFGEPSKIDPDRLLYWEFYEQGGKIALRNGKWKLVCLNVNKYKSKEDFLNGLDPENNKLFDLSTNPSESDEYNLVEKEEFKQKLLSLKKTALAQRITSGIKKFSFNWE